MYYELDLAEPNALEILEVIERRKDFAIFKELNGNKHSAFMFIHGTSEGRLMVEDTSFSLNEIACMLASELRQIDSNIKTLYTISCHGGLQKACVVEGIEFRSLHSCPNKVIGTVLHNDETNGYSLLIGEEY